MATDEALGLKAPELTPGARRIVEVASELFYRHGIHAVGVDTIARESGITKRTLYNRFGSKDALVAVYLQCRHERWWQGFEQRIASTQAPQALAVFDAYADAEWVSDRGCAFLNAAGELAADHPAYRVVQDHKRAVRDRMAELVRVDCPGVGEPEALAEHLYLLLEGAMAHRGIDGDAALLASARQLAEELILATVSSEPIKDR